MSKSIWLIMAFSILVSQLHPVTVKASQKPDERFGITEAFWQPMEASELGVGWERILFYWREMQPTGPNDWNTLHVLEEWLIEADAQGRTVVGLLKNTAPWASEDGTEAGLPKGLYLPEDHPDNLWANYVRRIATYYGKRNVHHWIIWNEPEIKAGVYGHEFAGDVRDYHQMLKIAYKVIKAEDSKGIVHLAGLTWWHDQTYLDRLLEVISQDPEAEKSNHFFDVISLHIYFRPETIPVIMNAVKSLFTKYGIDKEIWINETNAPPNRDPYWPVNRPNFQVDLDQQAWFILQAFGLGFGTGAQRISVYKLIDIHLPPGGESFGLLRPDFSKRPAFIAYKIASRYLRDFQQVNLAITPDYYLVSFDRPKGDTRLIWARTPTTSTVDLPADYDRARLISYDGTSKYIAAQDGFFRIELDGARCYDECLIGGPPLLLVEIKPSLTIDPTRIYEKISQMIAKIEDEIIADRPKSEVTPLVNGLSVGTPSPTFGLGSISSESSTPTPFSGNSSGQDRILELDKSPTKTPADKSHNTEDTSEWVTIGFLGVFILISLTGFFIVIRGKRTQE